MYTAMRSEDDARASFGHLFGSIFEAVTEGVRDYYRDHPQVNHKHSIGSRRLLIRDYIIYRLRTAVSEIDGIHVFIKNQTTNFGINSRFLARVHKLGKELLAAVGHTQASLSFQENNPVAAGLGEDFAEATCLRIGYVPIAASPLDPRVFITCPSSRRNAWYIELQRGEGAAIIPAPVAPPPTDIDDLVEVVPTRRRARDEE
jgi:hypothetical protein